MISENPRTAVSGVRSSWLILARNSDFARFAASARNAVSLNSPFLRTSSSSIWLNERARRCSSCGTYWRKIRCANAEIALGDRPGCGLDSLARTRDIPCEPPADDRGRQQPEKGDGHGSRAHLFSLRIEFVHRLRHHNTPLGLRDRGVGGDHVGVIRRGVELDDSGLAGHDRLYRRDLRQIEFGVDPFLKRMTDHFAFWIDHDGMAAGTEGYRPLQADQIVGGNDAVSDPPFGQRPQDEKGRVPRDISLQIGDDRFVVLQLAAKVA